jgi:hypothetical protein
MKPGPTGRFPSGKRWEHDEGELYLGMTIRDNTLILNFGKQIAWIGLDIETAKQLVAFLNEGIEELEAAQ